MVENLDKRRVVSEPSFVYTHSAGGDRDSASLHKNREHSSTSSFEQQKSPERKLEKETEHLEKSVFTEKVGKEDKEEIAQDKYVDKDKEQTTKRCVATGDIICSFKGEDTQLPKEQVSQDYKHPAILVQTYNETENLKGIQDDWKGRTEVDKNRERSRAEDESNHHLEVKADHLTAKNKRTQGSRHKLNLRVTTPLPFNKNGCKVKEPFD